jgi:hypothetical protein
MEEAQVDNEQTQLAAGDKETQESKSLIAR